jgi:hypothetical protein
MTIEERIKAAMGRMIERKLNIESVEVNSWSEDIEKGWRDGCSTCGYGADEDTYSVEIWYHHSGAKQSSHYRYDDSFGNLIRELDSDD